LHLNRSNAKKAKPSITKSDLLKFSTPQKWTIKSRLFPSSPFTKDQNYSSATPGYMLHHQNK